jgi:hypothetical protein
MQVEWETVAARMLTVTMLWSTQLARTSSVLVLTAVTSMATRLTVLNVGDVTS